MAKHEETKAKRDIVYNVISKCIVKGNPDAFQIAENIMYNYPVTQEQNRILNTLEEDAEIPWFPNHHLAYAYYSIAEKIGDSRAAFRKNYFVQKYPPEELKNIDEILHKRYLPAYLNKCFSVPNQYLVHEDIRKKLLSETSVN
ncbi:hypothetical protein N9W34_06570 [Rickettsiales bacterium]|nr:hypothetical protein [Rickettsiales bacterium]